jgi:hypothetical protein
MGEKMRARDKQVKPVREAGFYWLKYKGEWVVGKCDSYKWALPRIGIYKYQSDIDDVGHQVMRDLK